MHKGNTFFNTKQANQMKNSHNRAKNAVLTARKYDAKHLVKIIKKGREIKKIYEALYAQVAYFALQTGWKPNSDDDLFLLRDFPALERQVDEAIDTLQGELVEAIGGGIDELWQLSNDKNDAMLDAFLGASKTAIPGEFISKWYNRREQAQTAFRQRRIAGMNLSDRIWKLTEPLKGQLELALETGIADGRSAASLSRDVRQYLEEPEKLFRRVRDRDGVLRLSKAAAAYHPGQGVYRSSYKNALRLTATETNMAYRSADNARWANIPFIIGQKICLSNNHTLNGVPFVDICDDLAGVYPKEFPFIGWHPLCRCHAESVMCSDEEYERFQESVMEGTEEDFVFSGRITDMPDNFKKWEADNADRLARAEARGTLPYFMRNDIVRRKPIKEVAEIRDFGSVGENRPGVFVEKNMAKHKEELKNMGKNATGERAYIYLADGRVMKKESGVLGIDFSSEETSLLSGAALYHNHPYGTLSPNDVMFAVRKKLSKVSAITDSGEYVVEVTEAAIKKAHGISLVDLYHEAEYNCHRKMIEKDSVAFGKYLTNMKEEHLKEFCDMLGLLYYSK